MRGWKAAALTLTLAALLLGGLMALFNADFAGGSVYPEYSTMRADPAGAKLLFESLARLPGIGVTRNFMPLQNLAGTNATVVLLNLTQPDLDLIGQLALTGDRVVAALDQNWTPEAKESDAIFKQWGVRIAVDSKDKENPHLYFSEAKGWTALPSAHVQAKNEQVMALQRTFGKGTIALLASSADFSNQSSVAQDRLQAVTAALGTNTRIVFDESHLGIAETGSVMALARRFRLMGIAAGLAILAALFIWRNASSFPPPEPIQKDAAQPLGGRTSAAGLLTLLRKNLAPRELMAACWQEWSAGRKREFSPERVARAEALARTLADQPLQAAREIHSVLHSKGSI